MPKMSHANFIVVLLTVLALAGCNETIESEYKSFAEAKTSGAVERGWIPSIVPETALNIVEKHNLDTNRQVLRFSYAPDMKENLLGSCKQVSPGNIVWPKLNANWWPSQLTTSLATHSEVFFWCPEANGFVATNYKEHVYFWRN